MKSKVIGLFILLVLTQCHNTEGIQVIGTSYFPMEPGKYWIYKTDSTVYNDFNNSTVHLSSWTRIQIDSVIMDGEGQPMHCFSHYWRRQEQHPWQFQRLSWIKRTRDGVERIMDDRREVLMIFPVNNYTYWDRNSYNSMDERRVRYVNMGDAFQVPSGLYWNTVEVEWPEDKNPYFHSGSREIYGSAAGLIYASFIETETQNGKTKGYSYETQLQETNW